MPHIRAAQRVINKRVIMWVQTLEAPQVRITAHLDDLAYGERHAHVCVLRNNGDALCQGALSKRSHVAVVASHVAFTWSQQSGQDA